MGIPDACYLPTACLSVASFDPWGEVPAFLNPLWSTVFWKKPFPNLMLPLPALSMSKQEPAASVAPCWFPTCCCEGIATISCSADKLGAVCGGSWIFFFPLNYSFFKRDLRTHQPNRCSWKVVPLLTTVDPAFWRCFQNGGHVFILEDFCVLFCFFFLSLSALQSKLPGFLFPCFSDESFWVGSQSGRIQPPTHPDFPPQCPGYMVTSGILMISAGWCD